MSSTELKRAILKKRFPWMNNAELEKQIAQEPVVKSVTDNPDVAKRKATLLDKIKAGGLSAS